jgi:hypothetical protein
MTKNYFKIASRSLFENRISSFISIGGLAVGLAVMQGSLGCGSSPGARADESVENKVESQQYVKSDLIKIKWIEGKWKGLYKGEPFYEIYQFVNDTTLEITSYEWNGTDSSKSKKSYLYFKDGFYWLGDKQNWKVTSITESEIKMLPNVEAYNDIIWKYTGSFAWDAMLTSKKGTTIYNMQSFDPFKK